MKNLLAAGCMLSIMSTIALQAQNLSFDSYFTDSTLRIDYLLSGNNLSEQIIFEQIKKTKTWAGRTDTICAQKTIMGNYRYNIYDSATNNLLYSHGYSSLFNEWQTTIDAKQRLQSYYHTNLCPLPKNTIKFELEKRQIQTGQYIEIGTTYINPNNYFILNEQKPDIEYTQISGNRNPHNAVDIAFIAEGYTNTEIEKFNSDVKRIWDYFTTIPPFNKHAQKFNIYAVASVSQQSGTDLPGKHIYANTVLNSTFYIFDIERYLATTDLKNIHNIAAVVPYDHIFILVNSDIYGGGGFYNYYAISTSNHALSEKVAIHEFGHSFAGLADEYYASEVAYNDFYSFTVEPWEPNITTLVNFSQKWADMISKNTPIPTPRNKKYENTIGVFEGGGYVEKGIYSPVQDCRMKSNAANGFCAVCQRAIEKTINAYSKP